MRISNAARDAAEERVEQEREAQIEAARRRISRPGRAVCDCGATISDYRREKCGAVRCLECQEEFEREVRCR